MMTITDDWYDLRISAYTPTTFPMGRLAEYLAQLSILLGEKERVHFSKLENGCTRLLCRVEPEAAFVVRENVIGAMYGDERSDATRAYNQLNKMLRENSADAALRLNGSEMLSFPGCRAILPPKLGPFTQDITKEGVLVRIGGKDASAHATIEDDNGETWSFQVTRDLARQLAAHLFGNPVRLIGSGRCLRDEYGKWQFSALKASRFTPLDGVSLVEAVAGIQEVATGSWQESMDTVSLMAELRAGGVGEG